MTYITVVSGFHRCGSSLTMQMLHAGGIEPHGSEWPSYETDAEMTQEWLSGGVGKCVKILEPLHVVPPRGLPYRFIWLDRRPKQQALSAIKFLEAADPGSTPGAGGIDYLARSYRRERPKCLRLLRNRGPVLVVRFEDLLAQPLAEARRMAEFLGRDLNVDAMADEVLRRPPECLPFLLEEAQIRQKRARAQQTDI